MLGFGFLVPFAFSWVNVGFAVYPLRCSLGLLGFALRDSAAAPKARGSAHEGFTLAGGAPESVAPAAPSDPKRR